MPDFSKVKVSGYVRFQCPEFLFRTELQIYDPDLPKKSELRFKPELNGKSCKSLHALTWASVQESVIDVRKDLCKNIILSGGSTMYEGLAERLKNEITNLAPGGAEIQVIAPADRKYSVWKGAASLASLSTFATSWVTAEDYAEHGAAIVHRKCN
jgi:actin-related protein